MASTTLMTFLLCTSPHVRSVQLLGSWDNFSKPYAMERDKRVGSGHWRGCHTFTDITFDGIPNNAGPARSGGLKMGSTYWYYYLLDDDVEYFNDAEPVTTHCPFLPGQLVNVLHVPIILPDTLTTHSRARSPSTQTTEQTMNPEDKYMNPREPPKPKPRLRTSPSQQHLPTPNWPFSTSPLGAISRSASQPGPRLPKIKHSRAEDKPARSVSPPRSKGLRAAFRQWNTSTPSISPVAEIGRGILAGEDRSARPQQDDRLHVRSHSNESYMRTPRINIECSHGDGLPFRRPVSAETHDSVSLSIQERRALNSKAPGASTPKNGLCLRPMPALGAQDHADSLAAFSHSVKRTLSTPSTPSMLRRPPGHTSDPDETITPTPFTVVEKRLPTLPNSPSSVMDEALRDLEARERDLDMEVLASRFSDFTEPESVHEEASCEKSRFSEWSTDTDLVSPESMTSSSTLDEKQEDSPAMPATEFSRLSDTSARIEGSDPDTPDLTVGSKPSPAYSEDSPRFDLPAPRLTITLSPSDLNIPGLYIDEEGEDPLESNPKRHAAFFESMELKGLGLTSPDASTLRFPDSVQDAMSGDKNRAPADDSHLSTGALMSQSATMKEMMDELSYLKNMIQSGDVPEL
ncbi:hypothetical protein BJX61DRAFT_403378 [Aspergillus egyptiacus]|nr:hypothetical protein BJX61DRAFT_403378 [Aspergillus egyptiacus]